MSVNRKFIARISYAVSGEATEQRALVVFIVIVDNGKGH